MRSWTEAVADKFWSRVTIRQKFPTLVISSVVVRGFRHELKRNHNPSTSRQEDSGQDFGPAKEFENDDS